MCSRTIEVIQMEIKTIIGQQKVILTLTQVNLVLKTLNLLITFISLNRDKIIIRIVNKVLVDVGLERATGGFSNLLILLVPSRGIEPPTY